jgi:formylglycine-generating enzyme required for sulfatase activity/tRNA A-37 threonylcarbamoyl transferase component Bud32
MPHVEIFKSGVLAKRLDVSRQKAEEGCVIRLGSAGKVTLKLGEQTRLGEYEVRLVEDAEGSGEPGSGDAAKPAKSENVPRLEGYELQSRLGEGGMGTVWMGIQLSTKRAVAIKFLSSRAFESERSQRRFAREVELSAKLEHPNIARIYDSGLRHGAYYYAMELVQGLPLDEYIAGAKLNQRKILELMKTVCEAVQHAHERGVIHRDLKPSNIMVGSDGRPHVVDFGLAKSLLVDESQKQLTVSIEGDVSGTPAYMSPEQAAGKLEEIDGRTDVYSLGVMLYRLLVGHPPHDLSGSRYSVMKRIVEEEIRSPRELGVSINADLEGLLRKCLARAPADRYATAGDLARDIDNYLAGRPLVARKATPLYLLQKRAARHRIAVAAGAAAIVLVILIVTGMSPNGWLRERLSLTRVITVIQPPAVQQVIVPVTQPVPTMAQTSGAVAQTQPVATALATNTDPRPAGDAFTFDVLHWDGPKTRYWKRIDPTHWQQAYPDGHTEVFEVLAPDPAEAESIHVRRLPERTLEVLIPPLMGAAIKYRSHADAMWEIIGHIRPMTVGPTTAESTGIAASPPNSPPASEQTVLVQGQPRRQVTNSVGMKLIEIKPGSFLMGSLADEPGRNDDETQHKVTLTRSFWIGTSPVTQDEYTKVMGRNPSEFVQADNREAFPVEQVSWDDAVEFCAKLSRQEGKHYRLPTEAEWEYACRAGTTTAYCGGRDEKALADAGWYLGNAGYKLHPVDQKKPNAWGLYDMAGNVLQWCSDLYANYPIGAASDPSGPPTQVIISHVLRGGSFKYAPQLCRSASRMHLKPEHRYDDVGFRVVLDADALASPSLAATRPNPAAVSEQTVLVQGQPRRQVTNSIGMKLIEIKPGTFLMGTPAEEPGRKDDETQHKVTLTKGFLMATTHVTKGQFAAFVKDAAHYQTDAERQGSAIAMDGTKFGKVNGASWKAPGFEQTDNDPAVEISWNDAVAFCTWISNKEGRAYRLPTEAEWEYACRAGTNAAYFWGDNPDISHEFANTGAFIFAATRQCTTPVGSFKPNSWGIYDMSGDAWEWCGDAYGDYASGTVTDPTGTPQNNTSGLLRVIRGGSWYSDPRKCRSASREGNAPDSQSYNTGFRVVLDGGAPNASALPTTQPLLVPLPTPGQTAAGAENPSRKFTNSIGMPFVEMKPGTFLMGSPVNEPLRKASETQHKVTLTKPFFLATRTVNQTEWKTVMGSNPSHFTRDDLPVETVSYDDALLFCKKLGLADGKQYRLPTEAEWEYACRAGTTTAYYTGDGVEAADQAGWSRRNSNGWTHSSAQKLPNAWGLYDMHGNVWQWCSDWYAPFTRDDATDPRGPGIEQRGRVARGGSFDAAGGPTSCRSASRGFFEHGQRSRDLGLRILLEAAGVDASAAPGAATQPAIQQAPGPAAIRAPDTTGIQTKIDEFEDNFVKARLWNQHKDKDEALAYAGGTYEIQLFSPQRQCWVPCPSGAREDFICEIQAVFKGEHPQASWGLDLSGPNSNLAVMLSADGHVKACTFRNDSHPYEPTRRSLPTRLVAELVKPAANTITVRLKGTTCEVFLNGIPALDPIDIRPFDPAVHPGIAVEGGPAGADVEFHSYRVWLLKDHPELAN